jgi:hypothetical protein
MNAEKGGISSVYQSSLDPDAPQNDQLVSQNDPAFLERLWKISPWHFIEEYQAESVQLAIDQENLQKCERFVSDIAAGVIPPSKLIGVGNFITCYETYSPAEWTERIDQEMVWYMKRVSFYQTSIANREAILMEHFHIK